MIPLRNKVSTAKKEFAKKLRREATPTERVLWGYLRKRRLSGLNWRRQAVIRGYIVDFYCPAMKLAVEVDGLHHNTAKDVIRDRQIFKATGITVIRFSNGAVKNSLAQVIEDIRVSCEQRSFSTNPQDSSSS